MLTQYRARAVSDYFPNLSGKRIHVSKNANIKLKNFNQEITDKPKGLWYGIENSWIDWCLSEMPHWIHSNFYEIELNESKICKINTLKQFNEFEKKYKNNQRFNEKLYNKQISEKYFDIDYISLSEKFSGIEISPYFWQKRHTCFFYYGWDVASGCIWDKSAILNFKLIAKFNNKLRQYETIL